MNAKDDTMAARCSVTPVLLALIVLLQGMSAPLGVCPLQAAEPSFDGTKVRVGLTLRKPVSTGRIQALRGPIRYVLSPVPTASGTEPVLSQERSGKIAEEEDLTFQVTHRGITVRSSEGADYPEAFGKMVITSDGLFNLEVFNLAPLILSGKLEITLQDDGTVGLINETTAGEIIRSAVSEFSPSPEIEANKAFIVMARTRLKAALEQKRHASDTFDLCNTAHCLPFNGQGGNRELIEILHQDLPDLVMTAQGKTFLPYFHECCGGKVSSAKDIFGIEDTVHIAHEDRIAGKGSENCFHSPSFYWTREFSQEEMADFLSVTFAGGAGRIYLRWDPIKTDAAGRITEIRLFGRREQKMRGVELLDAAWEYFGINSLKSMRFTLEPMRRTTIYRGMGRGHGVGCCLMGADGLAKKGWRFEDILKFYFSGIALTKASGGPGSAADATLPGRPPRKPGRPRR